MEQLSIITQSLEQQTKKQIKDAIQQTLSSAELWKITAKDRLVYFSTKTENGELPLDLLSTQEFACVDKGKGILDELEKSIKLLDSKLQNVKIKKIRVDVKKQEIEKSWDNLFTLTLQLSNTSPRGHQLKQRQSSNSSLTESIILQDLKKNESFSRFCSGGDFFSSFCQDEPMLLKDMSIADWSESLTDDTAISQIKSPVRSSL